MERQLQRQREIEQEREEQRKAQLEQREAARREMERQRQQELEKQRNQELQQARQREQEKVLALKAQNQKLGIDLSQLVSVTFHSCFACGVMSAVHKCMLNLEFLIFFYIMSCVT